MNLLRTFGRLGLAAQFALLLAAALLVSHLAASFIFAREGTRYDREMRFHHDLGRLVALVHTLEQTNAETAMAVIERSSTGYTRFSIDPEPLNTGPALHLTDVGTQLAQALPENRTLARRPGTLSAAADRPALMLLSIRLRGGAFDGAWLNTLAWPLSPSLAWPQKAGLVWPLALSLLVTLAVTVLLSRQLTKPLRRLMAQLHAAGGGHFRAPIEIEGPSELRALAAAFQQMQERLAAHEEARGRILGAVGHDIRTPLTNLRIRTELIDDQDLREGMIRSIDEISVMTNDLLENARGISEQEEAQVLDLREILQELSPQAELPAEPVFARVRPVSLRRAIGNLLSNARRHGATAAPQLNLTLHSGLARISVTDHGPGMSLQRSAHALEARRGLGLAIVEKILRAHGGSLELKNLPQSGFRATAILPIVGFEHAALPR